METINIYAFADEANTQIDGQILAMQRNGLKGLEIRGVDGTNISEISLEKAREVKDKLDAAGLICWSIGSPIGKIKMESGDFEAHLEKFKHTLEIASILGAENIRMFSFFVPSDKDPAIYKEEIISRLKKMVALAKETGITLCHENEKGIYGDNAERCLEILTEVPDLRGIFDPANFVQCGVDTLKAWLLLKDKIYYMHIKDSLADGKVVPAGKGDGNVGYIVNEFIKQGGKDFTIEPHLKVFKGLEALEQHGDTSEVGKKYVYNSNEEAFDAACEAFKALL